MAFTDSEIAEHTLTIEKHFWSKRRPPRELRDKIRERPRFPDQSLDLFFIRPHWRRSEETIESPITRIRYVRSRQRWRIYWTRGDGKWHRYVPYPDALTLEKTLRVVEQNANGCFFG
ncbi:MAG: DUF3024 domain-containing protein [Chthoniobacterales bacterium]|jgi:hypothetical protein|nr:DUF3024 domain-containing protein [Chthoniobacterales bacterium]